MGQVQFVAIGEAMLEFSSSNGNATSSDLVVPLLADRNYKLSFAGDTFNTLFYFQQYAHLSAAKSYYATALGDDVMSTEMIAAWQQESIDTSLVARISDKFPGLYLISLDDEGERQFIYYRQNSAARDFCAAADFEKISSKISRMQYIYLSGITLAIYSEENRQKLFSLLQQAKTNGAKIIFDTNYRSALWGSKQLARAVVQKFYPLIDIALPTYDDERQLFNDTCAEDTVKRLQSYGVSEVVVKLGADGCKVAVDSGSFMVDVPQAVAPLDTTAAGDSFNGGYLAMRAAGFDPADAAKRAHQVAAAVIKHHGAIVRHGLPDFT